MITFLWGICLSTTLILLSSVAHLVRLALAKPYPPTNQFKVAVIVPCKGNDDPDFENNLRNIIQQQYSGAVQYLFCAESEEDSAVPFLRQLERDFPSVQVTIAGLATHCAQKTFNILKGMAATKANTEIFVLADADIQPHPTWLQELLGPFCDPKIGATTGFFRRIPMTPTFRWGDYLAGIFGSFIITGLSEDLLKGLWGGSLAVRKEIMDKYQIYSRLETEIVDDIAIMHALHQHKIERRYVQSATLKNYCDMSFEDGFEWFIRQTQFSQIYFKWLFSFYFVMIWPYAFLILALTFLFSYGLIAQNSLALSASLAFFLGLILSGYLLYRSIPINPANLAPGDLNYRLPLWLLMTPFAYLCAALVLLQTLLRVKNGLLIMRWRRITYHVEIKTGRVVEVFR